jgi:hypothetical protein
VSRAYVRRIGFDGPRRERAGDAQERLRHALDELVASALRDQLLGMNAGESVGDHEFGAQEADAVDRERGDSFIGECRISVHPLRDRVERGSPRWGGSQSSAMCRR